MKLVAVGFALALALVAAPALAPSLEPLSPAGGAEAARCLVGPGCIVDIVQCVRDGPPCGPEP